MALTGAVALVDPVLAAAPAVTAAGSLILVWVRGLRTAGQIARVFDTTAGQMNLVRCDRPTSTGSR